jgi:hypothetical protein
MESWLRARLDGLGCDGAVFAPYLIAAVEPGDGSASELLREVLAGACPDADPAALDDVAAEVGK